MRECEPLLERRYGVGVSDGEKFFCWTYFTHNIPCQFFCHFVDLLVGYICMTEELVNYSTVGKNHIKDHKTFAHATI